MVWEALDRVVQFEALGESDMASQTRAAWLEDYKVYGDSLEWKLEKLLIPTIDPFATSARAGYEIAHN